MSRKMIASLIIAVIPSIGGCSEDEPDINQWIVGSWKCGQTVMAIEENNSYKVAYYDMNDNFTFSASGQYTISGGDINFTENATSVILGSTYAMHVTNYFPPKNDAPPKMIYESFGTKDLECIGVRLKHSIPDPL